ncbi:hypothetical protein G3N58_16180 [Paraburkholderia sp. Ac-20342]|uniref:hypothetical protein n=1 Tax=Paraburkholderia sp. Ac-20342 TaxID=2703889 RepID=UPI00197E45F8|nr:hypothetical protein [Paraburkholderia sp. Ac-20342]MBN3848356.1 hypothetical protein [Paraburkholderia sp. Ac-20342]
MNLFVELAFTPELRTAMSQVQSALESRANAVLAIEANARDLESASTELPKLEQIAAQLQAEAIKCEALVAANGASKTDVTKAVKAADKAAVDFAEMKRKIERAMAARAVLLGMARDADAAIVEVKAEFTAVLAGQREQANGGFEIDLREACAGRVSLIEVVAVARAVDAEFPGGLCRLLLSNLKIISPRAYRTSHDGFGPARVTGTDLLTEEVMPATLPEEVSLSLREINAVVDALRRHKPFNAPKLQQPQQAEKPPRSALEQKRYDEAAERIRRSEEEYDERERRSKQPQTAEQRRKWTMDVRYPGTPAPRHDINASAAALGITGDDGGTVSDELRRIGALPSDSANSASNLHFHDDGDTISDEWRRIGALPPDSANSGGA